MVEKTFGGAPLVEVFHPSYEELGKFSEYILQIEKSLNVYEARLEKVPLVIPVTCLELKEFLEFELLQGWNMHPLNYSELFAANVLDENGVFEILITYLNNSDQNKQHLFFI